MTLPTSGPLSLGDIQTEFGGSPPTSISEYYNAAPGIPASGTIDFQVFYGKGVAPPEPPTQLEKWNNYVVATREATYNVLNQGQGAVNNLALNTRVAVTFPNGLRTGDMYGSPMLAATAVTAQTARWLQHIMNSEAEFNSWASGSPFPPTAIIVTGARFSGRPLSLNRNGYQSLPELGDVQCLTNVRTEWFVPSTGIAWRRDGNGVATQINLG